ncbi:MAG: DUF3168 domain-containing protein [Thermoguttaceae bacterium]|jgi:hypothetical protein
MTAGVMQAIHQRWAASAPLCALLPAAKVSTGASPNPSLPRAVLTKESDRPAAVCNDGSAVTEVGVRIEVFHPDYDVAAAVIRQAAAQFDRTDFPLPRSGRVINMRRTGASEQQQADGTWRMAVDFLCMVYCPAGT